jgi:hypothetical protein
LARAIAVELGRAVLRISLAVARKGFGFSGPWTVREQNHLLALRFGLPEVKKA